MGFSNYPNGFLNGITVRGLPILNTYSGNVFWVDSVTGSNGNNGKLPTQPFATIDYAVGRCTANKGDFILAMPGHNEGITAAAQIDLDVAGITLYGLGTGSNKPTIDFDNASGSVAVGADNVAIFNIRFRASANAIVVGLDIEDGVDYCHVIGCEFGWAETGTDEFAISIRTNDASNYALIEHCLIDAGAQAAESGIAFVKDTDKTIVRNNIIRGDFSTACIKGITTLSTDLLIEDNLLYNGVTSGLNTEPAIELLTGTSGIIRRNHVGSDVVTHLLMMVGDTMAFFENYTTDDVGDTTGAALRTTTAAVTASADA